MFQLTGYLTGFSSLKDGGASIRFATQELSPDDFATLHKAQNAFGWLVFKENEVTLQDIPDDRDWETYTCTPVFKRREAS